MATNPWIYLETLKTRSKEGTELKSVDLSAHEYAYNITTFY